MKLLTKEVVKQKKTKGLMAYPDLRQRWFAREVAIGEYWREQGRQRRKIKRTFPSRGQGRPRYDYADYLIEKLGELYVRVTKPTRRIISMAQLRAKYPLSESHIYGLIKQGKFPKPFPLVPGGRAVGWYEVVIDDYFSVCANDVSEAI